MQLNKSKLRGLSVILIIAIVLVILAGAFVAFRHFSNPGQTTSVSESSSGQALYSCPMHPEVVSDKPGKCPKCGMNLELKKT